MASSTQINLKKTDVIKASLRGPHDVICHNERYIIASTYNNCIMSVSCNDFPDQRCIYKGDCHFKPYSIVALSGSDNHFLITNDGGRNTRGCVFELKNSMLCPWAVKYEDFNSPTGIAVCEEEVFVADWESNCIHVFNMAGEFDRVIKHGNLMKPWFLAFNSSNLLYVASLHDIYVFQTDGSCKCKFRIDTAGKVWHYRGIAIDAQDNIYITARSATSRFLSTKETLSVLDVNHVPVTDYTGGWLTFDYLRGLCIDNQMGKAVVVNGQWHELKLFSLHSFPSAFNLLKSKLRLS